MPNLSELLYYTGETSTQAIVWSMFIGVIIAAVVGYLIKAKFGVFIRALLEKEINSPEKAVSLEELGLHKKLFIKLGLKSRSNYKNMLVAITEDGKFYANDTYTTVPPAFKEFIIVKRKRNTDVIKETKTDDSNVPLSGLARILQTKEKAAETKSENAMPEDTIKETELSATENSEAPVCNHLPENGTPTEEIKSTRFSETPRERVKFDITKAKYYISPEIHDRAYSLYHAKSSKSNAFIQIAILLIILGLLAAFSGDLISGFTDFLGGIKNPFEKPTI